MPLQIVCNDITKMAVDAIVNAAKPSLLGGGGVDGAIHAAAGPKLLEECRTLGGCETGQAKITRGYDLPCRYVIHTVGPVWEGGGAGEREKLISCYRSALALARENGCETVAFPLISAGIYGYPKDRALKTAVDAIGEFLLDNDMTVYLVVYGPHSLQIGHKLFSEITEFIDDNYVAEHDHYDRRRRRRESNLPYSESVEYFMSEDEADAVIAQAPRPAPKAQKPMLRIEPFLDTAGAAPADLARARDSLDESFQQMLLRKIDERGMTDAACYKKANVDRKLLSKIRSDVHYRPSKQTAIAFAIALELDLAETEDLLKKAGYALSNSSKADVIIQFFLRQKRYNIHEINECLFFFDQKLLGA